MKPTMLPVNAADTPAPPSSPLKVGIFSVGLDTYWAQFPLLKQRLNQLTTEIAAKVAMPDVVIINFGMVDTIDRAYEVAHASRCADVDLLLLHVATYALSSTVLPILRRLKVPVLVLNIAPEAAMDYGRINAMRDPSGNPDRIAMTGEWLAYCGACPVPELANVFERAGVAFHMVTGVMQGDSTLWSAIAEWLNAARVAYRMEHNRLGVMGHFYSGMLDVYSDLTLQSAVFGTHIEILEVDELASERRRVTEKEIHARNLVFDAAFAMQPDCSPFERERAARTSVALDRLAARYQLGSMAYYYKGSGVAENLDAMSSIILGTSLLTGRGIPVAGECEIKNVQAMKILDLLGAGGSFTEYYAIDFNDDVILLGHDGPGHIAIAEGRPQVRPLTVYHGKVGNGLSIEMAVRQGPVTLLSIVEDSQSGLKMLVAEGESVSGPILEIGNTNSRCRFPLGVRGFVESWNSQGPAHHCAIGVGHVSGSLRKLASLLRMRFVQVC